MRLSRPTHRALSTCLAVGLFAESWLGPGTARADVDARRLLETLAQKLPGQSSARALGLSRDFLGVTAELPPGVDARRRGLIPVMGSWAVARGSAAELYELMANNPDVRFGWAPPYRPLLDRIDSWAHAGAARADTGLTGAGVVVGVIDTGVDTKHPALRDPNGRTRVRWLIDFAEAPLGLHPELEAAYGCSEDQPCAVLSAADIDERLNNAVVGDEATDRFGHGTHVASIAAGNGAPDGHYVGIAPAADLIIAQVGNRDTGTIFDVNILTSARFIFDRADELAAPAVLNISLGSNFGAHDGSSALERGLASFAEGPGRGVVVASGNSAAQYRELTDDYPPPFGIHAEVHVASHSTTRVPLIIPAFTNNPLKGMVLAWVAGAPSDDLRVGLSSGKTLDTPRVPRGGSWVQYVGRQGDVDDFSVVVLNGVGDNPTGIHLEPNSTIVIVSGQWRAGRTFALELEGNGSARIWLESNLDPNVTLGALLPASRKSGTVSMPATHPNLIAVGATMNRKSWSDHSGTLIEQPGHGALADAPEDTTAFFSAAGPTNVGVLKPDLVAPGVNVIAAMSAEADPRVGGNELGQFNGIGRCAPYGGQCLVVDDSYAIASGTSMAAPAVTGAVALLLQRDPTLTQTQIRALLQAGSRPLEGAIFAPEQVGAGSLDVVGALLAQDAATGAPSDPTEARIELAQSFVYPDAATPLRGVVIVRDGDGRPARGFDPARLSVTAKGAARVELEPRTEGLWDLELAAPRGAGGRTVELTITFDGAPLAERSIPVAVDPFTAQSGFRSQGACGVSPVPRNALSFAWPLCLAFGCLARWARRSASSSSPRDIG